MTYELETHVNNGASPSALNKKILTAPQLLPVVPSLTSVKFNTTAEVTSYGSATGVIGPS